MVVVVRLGVWLRVGICRTIVPAIEMGRVDRCVCFIRSGRRGRSIVRSRISGIDIVSIVIACVIIVVVVAIVVVIVVIVVLFLGAGALSLFGGLGLLFWLIGLLEVSFIEVDERGLGDVLLAHEELPRGIHAELWPFPLRRRGLF